MNVIAGNAMGRRAVYMYGALLPRNPRGGVNGGLGQTTSTGNAGLIVPNVIINKTGTAMTIDGVKVVFQMTPGTEAPAEMNAFFPDLKSVWMAENATRTLHNVLTLRGAKVRDPLIWAHYLGETIDMWGSRIDSAFASHHWPMWDNARILDFLSKQRARYYGSVKHDSRAVYQRYMGFYDANPSTLDELPPAQAAAKYVEYMGGANAVMDKAQGDFDQGNYRWVAMALKHVVFADPSNTAAKNLLADAYEQMGYQAESGPWRSIYLQGAFELRNGVPSAGGTVTASPDTIRAMSPELLFDYLGVRLNGEKAAGRKIRINVNFTDLKRPYSLTVENGALSYSSKLAPTADATMTLNKTTLDSIGLGETTLDQAVAAGDIKVEGRQEAIGQFLGMLDTFPFWFNIVTP